MSAATPRLTGLRQINQVFCFSLAVLPPFLALLLEESDNSPALQTQRLSHPPTHQLRLCLSLLGGKSLPAFAQMSLIKLYLGEGKKERVLLPLLHALPLSQNLLASLYLPLCSLAPLAVAQKSPGRGINCFGLSGRRSWPRQAESVH